MKASAQGHVEVVDTLIQAGTIVNLKKNNGQTALAIAVVNQQLKIVNKLLLVGADPTIKDEVGFTPPCMMHVHSTLDLHHVYTVESPTMDYPIISPGHYPDTFGGVVGIILRLSSSFQWCLR